MKNLLLIQPNPLLQRLYPKAVWHMGRSDKTIYLTFDDGPVPITEWVIEELEKYGIKATFFCVGANILKNPQIFERLKQTGHSVANHTMFHPKGFKKSVKEYLREVEDCKKLVGNNLFRPPYGQLRRGQYKALVKSGYKIILWDVISYDYEQISTEKCENNVMKNTKNGSIVLFHDSPKAEKNIKHALPVFLKHFTGLGYSFAVF